MEPVEDSNKWPELLSELMAVFDVALAANDSASAEDLVLALSEHIGGRMIYIPKATIALAHMRASKIYDEFTGDNYTQLIRKYALSEPHLRRLINAEGKRRQALRTNQLF